MHKICFLFLLFFVQSANAQMVTELSNMPEALSNNAVCLAETEGKKYVYSFGGIDESKEYSGIHKRCYRYDIEADIWEAIPELPSGNGRIAAGASTVKNKIYIFGGFEVFEDDTERTFNEVHIFDPSINDYLPNGNPIPVPTDDHVQVVYKDSLIFLITGWSNDDNIPNVQIYNGASGVIIGDTIYYSGGVRIAGGAFAMANTFRKGFIDPSDPTLITWEAESAFLSRGYRMASGHLNNEEIIWIGGSDRAYNYNALAYADQQGVEPLFRILQYSVADQKFKVFPLDIGVMDFRGLAQLNDNSYIICGGMGPGQEVSSKTFKIEFLTLSDQNLVPQIQLAYPNPLSQNLTIPATEFDELRITNNVGLEVLRVKLSGELILNMEKFAPGIYYLQFKKGTKEAGLQKIIKI